MLILKTNCEKKNKTKNQQRSDRFAYNVILDELLVAQEDLLPAEDGGLRPGVKRSGARVHRCQHLPLRRYGNTSYHLISGLRSGRESIKDELTESKTSDVARASIKSIIKSTRFLSFTGLTFDPMCAITDFYCFSLA